MTAALLASRPALADAPTPVRSRVRHGQHLAATRVGAAACKVDTPLGAATLLATPQGLAGLWFDGQAHHPGEVTTAGPPAADAARHLADAQSQLAAWWRGERIAFTLALDPQGTPFQRAVWRALLEIPYGGRTEYGRIASGLGLVPGAARAVGGAVGRNPLSVIVPCHRVVGRDGALTGYAGGLDRKRWLLAHEARVGGRA